MGEKRERVSVKEASEILGLAVPTVRYYMWKNRFHPPIGYVDKPNGEKGRKEFRIYRDMLNKHIGKESGGE